MGTGYMGMDEPVVIPQGQPQTNEPTTETITNPVTDQGDNKPEPVKTEPVVAKTEPEPVKQEPQIVEKVVEKIVEKYPEFKDDSAKELFERFVNGDTDGIYSYLSEIKKDYATMSDLDVVRAGLSKKNPGWSKEDVELEIRSEYGKQLEKYDLDTIDKDVDPEGYKEAVAHNERADANLLKLQRDARDQRHFLKENQKTIELPKIAKPEAETTAPPALTQEQIDESKRVWAEQAATQVPSIGDFKFQVGDDKNPEEVVFAITNEEKPSIVEKMKTWTGAKFMAKRGWTDENGQFNLLKIAEDVYALENLSKMIKSVHTQAKNATTKEIVADIKNIDLDATKNTSVQATPANVGALIWG